MYKFTIPIEPIPKQSVKVDFKRKRTYQPAKYKKFTERVRWHLRSQLGKQSFPKELLDCALICEVTFYLPRPKSAKGRALPYTKPDLGNLEKPICDALEGILISNDSRICDLVLQKRYAEESPCIIIWLGIWG